METLLLYSKCRKLDKTIPKLELKSTAARAAHGSARDGFSISGSLNNIETNMNRKYFMVIGINTAFSSRKRRDSIRATWMPQGALTWLHISLFLSKLRTCYMLFYFLVISNLWSMGFHGLNITRWEEKEVGGREGHCDTLCHWSQVIFIRLHTYCQLVPHILVPIYSCSQNSLSYLLMLLSLASSFTIIRHKVCGLSRAVLCIFFNWPILL